MSPGGACSEGQLLEAYAQTRRRWEARGEAKGAASTDATTSPSSLMARATSLPLDRLLPSHGTPGVGPPRAPSSRRADGSSGGDSPRRVETALIDRAFDDFFGGESPGGGDATHRGVDGTHRSHAAAESSHHHHHQQQQQHQATTTAPAVKAEATPFRQPPSQPPPTEGRAHAATPQAVRGAVQMGSNVPLVRTRRVASFSRRGQRERPARK